MFKILNPITVKALSTTRFNLFNSQIKSQLLETKCVFKHQDLLIFGLKLNNMSDFYSIEVVYRCRQTQLSLSADVNY